VYYLGFELEVRQRQAEMRAAAERARERHRTRRPGTLSGWSVRLRTARALHAFASRLEASAASHP
jgi:hypothetical protein